MLSVIYDGFGVLSACTQVVFAVILLTKAQTSPVL
jgi:hypothetical protein